jgi:hypothetical protein
MRNGRAQAETNRRRLYAMLSFRNLSFIAAAALAAAIGILVQAHHTPNATAY